MTPYSYYLTVRVRADSETHRSDKIKNSGIVSSRHHSYLKMYIYSFTELSQRSLLSVSRLT